MVEGNISPTKVENEIFCNIWDIIGELGAIHPLERNQISSVLCFQQKETSLPTNRNLTSNTNKFHFPTKRKGNLQNIGVRFFRSWSNERRPSLCKRFFNILHIAEESILGSRPLTAALPLQARIWGLLRTRGQLRGHVQSEEGCKFHNNNNNNVHRTVCNNINKINDNNNV